MQQLTKTDADNKISSCIRDKSNFAVIAGAGSGKTTSLITTLEYLQATESRSLIRNDQKIVCITYTNRAVDVISQRLDWNELFLVSTLHKFLWDNIQQFNPNIREALRNTIIPNLIDKKKEKDNGGTSKSAIKAREQVASLKLHLINLDSVENFTYSDTNVSDYSKGELSHDDVITLAAHLINQNSILQLILGQKFPYIFVDEAQDTFSDVVNALNNLCKDSGLPIVGYFGDPMQQIYDKRAGDFATHDNLILIRKEENYRSSPEVVRFLNAFRTDIKQFPAGRNKQFQGSVLIKLIEAEIPQAPRRRYSEEQLIRTSERFDEALSSWDLKEDSDTKHLFLARQMIARRLGFPTLQVLFTGQFASQKAQEDYEKGLHFLLKPFLVSLCPLIKSVRNKNTGQVLNVLRETSPAFDPEGKNSTKTLKEMVKLSEKLAEELYSMWDVASLGDILRYAQDNNLCSISDRLAKHLARQPRDEEYDSEIHSAEKSDWLADRFLMMNTTEIEVFAKFIDESTPFSTQHGVKGEEYKDVLVVFDDIEAAWNNYSFTKTLTPNISGTPTQGQYERTTKLAYVCFSRTKENLRVILFTPDPHGAKRELIDNGLLSEEQIEIRMNK